MEKLIPVSLTVFFTLLVSCATQQLERVSYIRVISNHERFTSRELLGEVENVIRDLGYRKSTGGKWLRRNEPGYITLSWESKSSPALNISVYLDTRRNSFKADQREEVMHALHSHFSRRMARDEVKLLRAIE